MLFKGENTNTKTKTTIIYTHVRSLRHPLTLYSNMYTTFSSSIIHIRVPPLGKTDLSFETPLMWFIHHNQHIKRTLPSALCESSLVALLPLSIHPHCFHALGPSIHILLLLKFISLIYSTLSLQISQRGVK